MARRLVVPILLTILLAMTAVGCDGGNGGVPWLVRVLLATEESSVIDSQPDANMDADSLLVQNYSTDNARAYVRFDVSSIPAGAVLLAARAELYYCLADGMDDIAVYPSSGDWSADAITWNNQPGPGANEVDVVNLAPNFPASSGDLGSYVALPGGEASKAGWYISSLVREWIQDPSSNDGIVFAAFPEIADPDPPGRLFGVFGSSEETPQCPDNPPRLRVWYLP